MRLHVFILIIALSKTFAAPTDNRELKVKDDAIKLLTYSPIQTKSQQYIAQPLTKYTSYQQAPHEIQQPVAQPSAQKYTSHKQAPQQIQQQIPGIQQQPTTNFHQTQIRTQQPQVITQNSQVLPYQLPATSTPQEMIPNMVYGMQTGNMPAGFAPGITAKTTNKPIIPVTSDLGHAPIINNILQGKGMQNGISYPMKQKIGTNIALNTVQIPNVYPGTYPVTPKLMNMGIQANNIQQGMMNTNFQAMNNIQSQNMLGIGQIQSNNLGMNSGINSGNSPYGIASQSMIQSMKQGQNMGPGKVSLGQLMMNNMANKGMNNAMGGPMNYNMGNQGMNNAMGGPMNNMLGQQYGQGMIGMKQGMSSMSMGMNQGLGMNNGYGMTGQGGMNQAEMGGGRMNQRRGRMGNSNSNQTPRRGNNPGLRNRQMGNNQNNDKNSQGYGILGLAQSMRG